MERVEIEAADYERMYEAAVEMARSLIRETNAKGEKILRLRAEVRELREKVGELRYNPYHDPTNGRFTSGNGVDISGGSGIIKAEIEKGTIKLEINPEKQARHIKGSSEYKEGRSYLTINVTEAQDVINIKNGTGILLKDKDGKPVKERIDCGRTIGVDVDKNSRKETITDKGTIHYSKTGTHLVPRKDNKNDD